VKIYRIEIKEHRDEDQVYFVVSASLEPLGSIIAEGKDLREACRNLIGALELALEKSKKKETEWKIPPYDRSKGDQLRRQKK